MIASAKTKMVSEIAAVSVSVQDVVVVDQAFGDGDDGSAFPYEAMALRRRRSDTASFPFGPTTESGNPTRRRQPVYISADGIS